MVCLLSKSNFSELVGLQNVSAPNVGYTRGWAALVPYPEALEKIGLYEMTKAAIHATK